MSNVPSVQPTQHFLELIGRLYKKRDGILESSNRLVDYSYNLENCNESGLEDIRSKINKELNKIISDVNELAPLLSNPQIIGSILGIVRILNSELEEVDSEKEYRHFVAKHIRDDFCPIAVMTQLILTPKSIKKTFGIEVGMKDVVNLKGMFEHHQENY